MTLLKRSKDDDDLSKQQKLLVLKPCDISKEKDFLKIEIYA